MKRRNIYDVRHLLGGLAAALAVACLTPAAQAQTQPPTQPFDWRGVSSTAPQGGALTLQSLKDVHVKATTERGVTIRTFGALFADYAPTSFGEPIKAPPGGIHIASQSRALKLSSADIGSDFNGDGTLDSSELSYHIVAVLTGVAMVETAPDENISAFELHNGPVTSGSRINQGIDLSIDQSRGLALLFERRGSANNLTGRAITSLRETINGAGGSAGGTGAGGPAGGSDAGSDVGG